MKKTTELFLVLVVLSVLFSSCVTSTDVRFNTDVEGATVMVDGMEIGTTPTQVKMSNGIWEDPEVLIRKEGYKDLSIGVKKEVKVINAVTGWFLLVPWLYVYGPKDYQNYVMIKEN